MSGSILWLHERGFNSKHKKLLTDYMRRAGLTSGAVSFMTLHNKLPQLWAKKLGKSGKVLKDKWCANPNKVAAAEALLDVFIKAIKPKLIVINDRATLEVITKDYNSLDLCRGSVYSYKGIPCHVVDSVLKTFKVRHAPWLLLNDLRKLRRWAENCQRVEPKFQYTVCRTVADLQLAENFLHKAMFMGVDIETTSDFMSCVGYTGLQACGKIHTYVIPLFNPTKPGNAHWPTPAEEVQAWHAMRRINANSAIKVFQNGGYDCAYFIRYRIPVNNWLLDTLHLWHCIYTESPKDLGFLASVCLDFCKYWKDEAKGDSKDKIKTLRVPITESGLEDYWRYNGLDAHNTLMIAKFQLELITKPALKWALDNYNVEFGLTVGPALSMSMTGLLINRERQAFKSLHWMKASKQNLAELRTMTADPEFNANSAPQVAELIYDILGAPKITFGKYKGTTSIDQTVLKFVKLQHPLYEAFIEKLWQVKKPAANASKYGGSSISYRGRFMYSLSAAGTTTGRFSGKGHQFWVGTNPQNVPKSARDMLVADPGYILFEVDYSQSDNWFVAYECEDPDYIKNISDDRDTHSVHAEHFFKKPYAEIYKGHCEKATWVEDPLKGVRQLTKKVVHGANYQMAATTLYITMGHEAVVAAAKFLGFIDAHTWEPKKLINLCDMMLRSYIKLYLGLPTWFETSVERAIKNGNRATCAFGRTRLFFGNMATDKGIQRQLSAYYGQGGTAGNINRSLNSIYYETSLRDEGLILLTQTHDSITGQVKEDDFHCLINQVLTIVEQPCTIHGREFTVPVEAEVGYSWGKAMVPYTAELTLEKLRGIENAWGLKQGYIT